MLCRLEKPCLPHVKFRYMTGYIPPSCATSVTESNAGPGHVFTATASLLNDHCDEQPPERPFAVSPEEIDRLFRTSLSLELGPDCTPIQIWANLVRISSRYPISNNMLRVLVDECRKYIRCNRSVCSAHFERVKHLTFTASEPLSKDPLRATSYRISSPAKNLSPTGRCLDRRLGRHSTQPRRSSEILVRFVSVG